MAQYEAILAAALADHGLTLERTEIADDASWPGCEQLVVYVRGERKAVCDPILDGDLEMRARVQQIAERVEARIRERRACRAATASVPSAHGAHKGA